MHIQFFQSMICYLSRVNSTFFWTLLLFEVSASCIWLVLFVRWVWLDHYSLCFGVVTCGFCCFVFGWWFAAKTILCCFKKSGKKRVDRIQISGVRIFCLSCIFNARVKLSNQIKNKWNNQFILWKYHFPSKYGLSDAQRLERVFYNHAAMWVLYDLLRFSKSVVIYITNRIGYKSL